jgi:hypothetical protein
MLVEAIVLAVVSMAANQSMPVPYFDSLLADAEYGRHFLNRKHTCPAETIISWRELIAPLNASHDARREWLAFPGLHTLVVQRGRDLRIGVVIQQPVDFGNHFPAGLPLLPGSLR